MYRSSRAFLRHCFITHASAPCVGKMQTRRCDHVAFTTCATSRCSSLFPGCMPIGNASSCWATRWTRYCTKRISSCLANRPPPYCVLGCRRVGVCRCMSFIWRCSSSSWARFSGAACVMNDSGQLVGSRPRGLRAAGLALPGRRHPFHGGRGRLLRGDAALRDDDRRAALPSGR